MSKVARALLAAMMVLGVCTVTGGVIQLAIRPLPAYADGPVPCDSTTQPAFPYAGFCANYNGDVTWYGTYGPGFPTDQGFGLCADPPASGGGFPAPGYDYAPGAAPSGAGGDWNALGFAFSEGQANGWWSGVAGQFTADQVAAAAKILYDTVVWGSPVPSMDPGVLAAYDAFDNWFNEAVGMSNAAPQLFVGLTSAGTSFTGSATDDIHLQFPGTGRPMVGQGVLLSIINGTFNSPDGPTSIGASTDANVQCARPDLCQQFVAHHGDGYEHHQCRTTRPWLRPSDYGRPGGRRSWPPLQHLPLCKRASPSPPAASPKVYGWDDLGAEIGRRHRLLRAGGGGL